jgi:hypothetical protein
MAAVRVLSWLNIVGYSLEGAVRGNDDGPLFIAQRDDLEEQIGAGLVNWEIPQRVQDKQRGLGVFAEFLFETPSTLGGGQRVDDLDGTGQEDCGALEAGRIAQGCRQMGFTLLMTMPF